MLTETGEVSPAWETDLKLLARKLEPVRSLLARAFLHSKKNTDPVTEFIRLCEHKNVDIQGIKDLLSRVLSVLNYTGFFTQVGLNQELGFFSELWKRVEGRLLPPILEKNEVLWLADRVLSPSDAEWMELMTPVQLQKLFEFFSFEAPDLFQYFRGQWQSSTEILAQRISGLGLDPMMARKFNRREDLLHLFLELGRLGFVDNSAMPKLDSMYFLRCLRECENALLYLRSRREEEGTSLALTYRLFYLDNLITRLKRLLDIGHDMSSGDFLKDVAVLVRDVLLANYEATQVREFMAHNVEILAYQVTLLTGRTGEHYIANDGCELRKMWWKAIKGAMVVAVLVFIKVLAAKFHYPPLLQAFLFGSLYATGFVVIHQVGGVLATKQPAMTASTLAAAMGDTKSEKALSQLAEVIVRLLRTQIAALLGNYLFAFPIGVLLVWPFYAMDMPIMDTPKANLMLMDLHPWYSLSFFYAAVAGCCLFLAGLISGLADNWFDHNRIGTRLEYIFQGRRGKKFVASLQNNFGIWLGNIVLGFFLGSMSSVGIMTGLPLDIRHVTFASGSFGMSWFHQPYMMEWPVFVLFAVSVLVMGLINLTVSFSLSLFVAMKSRRLKFSQGRRLFWLLVRRLLRHPGDLFFDHPPRNT